MSTIESVRRRITPRLAGFRQTVRRLLDYGREIVIAPFQLTTPEIAAGTVEQRETARRARLVRLIIVFLTTVQLLIGIPAALANATPLPLLSVQAVGVAMGVTCLELNRRGHTTLAGAIYVYPAIISVFGGAVISAHIAGSVSDARSLLAYALQTVFILLIGLLLPLRMLWPTTLGIVVIMAVSVSLTPLAPGPGGENLQALIIVFLGLIYVASAALSWIAARSARAGITAVDRALEREREMTTLKDLFITDANHELRTPIMSLYNDVKILVRLGERSSAEVRARLMTRALGAGDMLLQLLNTVLDARVIDNEAALQLDIQPVQLAPLVTDVLETFDPHTIGEQWPIGQSARQPRDVTVAVAPSLVIMADPIRLRQILVNLVSNALKYSAAGSPISVTATGDDDRREEHYLPNAQPATSEHWIQISVQDHGLGIPAKELPLLFNRFVRLPRDITGSVRGTGLGLYICRRLVEAMGGQIGVTSSGIAGDGSRFFFVLPAGELAPAAGATTLPRAVAEGKA